MMQGQLDMRTLLPEHVQANHVPKRHLSTSITANRYPIHRWFNFIAGFSPEFVSHYIGQANLGTGEILIDPFSGLSTTLVQANVAGVRSIGFEPHPFLYDMSLAKLFPPNDRQEVDAIEYMAQVNAEPYRGELTDVWTQDALTFLRKLVSEPDLRLLAAARNLESNLEPCQQPLYRLIISRVLEVSGPCTNRWHI